MYTVLLLDSSDPQKLFTKENLYVHCTTVCVCVCVHACMCVMNSSASSTGRGYLDHQEDPGSPCYCISVPSCCGVIPCTMGWWVFSSRTLNLDFWKIAGCVYVTFFQFSFSIVTFEEHQIHPCTCTVCMCMCTHIYVLQVFVLETLCNTCTCSVSEGMDCSHYMYLSLTYSNVTVKWLCITQ